MIKNSIYKIGGLFRCLKGVRYEREGQTFRIGVAFGGINTKLPNRSAWIIPGDLCVLLSVDRIGCKFWWAHPEHGKIFTRFQEDDAYDGRLFHKTWEEVSDPDDHSKR